MSIEETQILEAAPVVETKPIRKKKGKIFSTSESMMAMINTVNEPIDAVVGKRIVRMDKIKVEAI
jgi:hypothetical protein